MKTKYMDSKDKSSLTSSDIYSRSVEQRQQFGDKILFRHIPGALQGNPLRNCHNPNSTSTQPQLNSNELGLTRLLLFTPPPHHTHPTHRELYIHRMQHQINITCCLNNNINIKDNNNNNLKTIGL